MSTYLQTNLQYSWLKLTIKDSDDDLILKSTFDLLPNDDAFLNLNYSPIQSIHCFMLTGGYRYSIEFLDEGKTIRIQVT